MRILLVNKVSPRLGGGAEMRLREVGKRLVARGHVVQVICGKTEAGLPDQEVIDGMEVHYLNLWPAPLFRFRRLSFYGSRYLFYPAMTFTERLIRQIQPDVIVDYASPMPSLVYLVAKQLGIPCCVDVCGYYGRRRFEGLGPVSGALSWIGEYALRRFRYNCMIATSTTVRAELEQDGISAPRTLVALNGLTLENFRVTPTPERNALALVVLGRLVKGKGVDYALEAMAEVRKQIPGVKLTVIGDGPERTTLEQRAAQLGLGPTVTFVGHISDTATKAHLLWQSSVFIMPSILEGFGIVMLEAMACGLPVVAFDLPVYREFTTNACGYFVPLRDVAAMAEKIQLLLMNPSLRNRMGRHNELAVQAFDWDRIVDGEDQMLAEVAARRPPAATVVQQMSSRNKQH